MQRFFTTLLIIAALAAWASPVGAQHQTALYSGQWVGRLTQKSGGYRTDYYFEINLQISGNQVTGRSYVSVDNIYAEMELVGFIAEGDVLHFQEERLVRAQKPKELEWCYKSGQLKLVRRSDAIYLEGPWQGVADSGPCIPGWIVLKKQVPKA
jgi:hypothetical protein